MRRLALASVMALAFAAGACGDSDDGRVYEGDSNNYQEFQWTTSRGTDLECLRAPYSPHFSCVVSPGPFGD